MKKVLLIFIAILILTSSKGQDSIQKPSLMLRPFVVTGVDFPRNETLRQDYGNQSQFAWGAGIQLGNPEKLDLIPFASYTISKFTIENPGGTTQDADTSLKINCITGGILLPVDGFEKTHLLLIAGYNYAKISETYSAVNANSHGFQAGIGAERKIIGNSRLYFEITYLYQKTRNTGFRDFDRVRLALRLLI